MQFLKWKRCFLSKYLLPVKRVTEKEKERIEKKPKITHNKRTKTIQKKKPPRQEKPLWKKLIPNTFISGQPEYQHHHTTLVSQASCRSKVACHSTSSSRFLHKQPVVLLNNQCQAELWKSANQGLDRGNSQLSLRNFWVFFFSPRSFTPLVNQLKFRDE